MTWRERIQEAAYTSPSGVRTVFLYENVSRTIEKRTTAFDFPDADGTFIQDLGVTGRRYPFRVIFSGDNYDLLATVFEETLSERGAGRLEHPLYGQIDVVPVGSITRRDDLKTAGNQAIIEVAFWETIGIIYPTGDLDPISAVEAALAAYNAAMAEQFDATVDLDSIGAQEVFKPGFTSLLDAAKAGLQGLADAQANVSAQFNAVSDSISNGLDILVGQPLTLAFQTMIMLQAPARALSLLQDRLDGYRNLLDSIINGPGGVGAQAATANDFRRDDLYSSSYVSSGAVASINNVFETRPDAINTAVELIEQLDALVIWRDDNTENLGLIDTGESYQALLALIAVAAGYLVDLAFSLKQERRIILDRAVTPIELTAELYGEVDAQLDTLIQSNQLTGSEILEIPKGREIVYYV